MFVDRALSGIETLGPGTRIAVWCAGCTKACPGCANPELWQASPRQALSASTLAEALIAMGAQTGTRRITFTGGDPLEQPAELACVLEAIRPAFDDVLVYTGYAAETLRDALGDALAARLRPLIDVLVEGPYVEALNDGRCALRGSTNQRVMVMNPALQARYDEALAQPRRVQNVYFDNRAMSVGIHGKEQ